MDRITFREWLLFIAITLTLLGISIALTFSFSDKIRVANLKYDRALVLENSEQISYGYDTATGYCFSTSKITQYENDVITDDYNEGNFIYLEMKAYKYELTTYVTTDSEGHSQVKTKWEWVYKNYESWEKQVNNVIYDDKVIISEYNFSKYSSKISTRTDYKLFGSDWRFEYYGVYFDDSDYTLFANFSDKEVATEVELIKCSDIETAKKQLKTGNYTWIILTWIGFALLEALTIYLFKQYETNWIED